MKRKKRKHLSEEEQLLWYSEIKELREQGFSWKEIAKKKGEKSAETLRKKFWFYKKKFGDAEVPDVLEKKGVLHWKKRAEELEKQLAIYEFLEKMVRNLGGKVKVPFSPKPVRTPEKLEMLLLLGDWHLGEEVSNEVMRGVNEYNVDIAIAAVERIVEKVLKVADLYGDKFDTINVVLLGDMLSGRIHEELRRGSIAASKQFLVGVKLLKNVFETLGKRFRVRAFGVPGNHGRFDKKMSFKYIYDNFDWILYKTVETTFEGNPQYEFDFPPSFSVDFSIYSFNFVATHGANVRMHYKLPFYGLYTLWETEASYLAQKGKFLDYMLVGHFHQPGELPVPASMGRQGFIILNGSLIGPNEYSFGKGLKPVPASQTLFFVHPRYGLTERMELIRDI